MKTFVILLTILFIALKLTGVIVWSWWLVLSPILAVVGFLLGCFILVGWGTWMLGRK